MYSIGSLAGWVAGWAAGWVAGWLSSDPQCPRERAGCELRATKLRRTPRRITTMYSEPLGSNGNLSKTGLFGAFSLAGQAGWLAAEKLKNLVRQSCF